jgi:hypothetical protein
MSELERLIEIARALPLAKVHALLSVAEQMKDVSHEEFLQRINSAAPLDVDEETAAELRAALSEHGKAIGHDELKHQLRLG